MNCYNNFMDQFVIKHNIVDTEISDKHFNLLENLKKKLLTPDVITAMQAGCHFDVTLEEKKGNITVFMKSREKVSILKTLDNVPVSVIIK